MFTLPEGFRPKYNAIHPGMHSGNAATWLYVYSSGIVAMPSGTAGASWASIQCTFEAEQ